MSENPDYHKVLSQSEYCFEAFEPMPPGTNMDSPLSYSDSPQSTTPDPAGAPGTPKLRTSSKGVENAKKRLRAFSIQKKAPLTPTLPKVASTGNTTVLIGKLCSTKVTPKPPPPEVDAEKKPPRPPKPGTNDSYDDLKNRTMAEIEDIKRRMEMVELGIPLGVICPSQNKLTPSKAMPTKAMPPIRVLEPAQIDEIIREAKQARAEGKEFKFDYHKYVPGYENPFQRKCRDEMKPTDLTDKADIKIDRPRSHSSRSDSDRHKDRKKGGKYESIRHFESRSKSDSRSDHKKDRSRDKHRERDKDRSRERHKERDRDKSKEKDKDDKKALKIQIESEKVKGKEADLNLTEYLICDSWSLDNEDKTSSPKVDDNSKESLTKADESKKVAAIKAQSKKVEPAYTDAIIIEDDSIKSEDDPNDVEIIKQVVAAKEEIDKAFKDPMEQFMENLAKHKSSKRDAKKKHVVTEPVLPKLKPVVDSFNYEIDPEDEVMLDIFDEATDLEKFAKSNEVLKSSKKDYDQDSQTSRDNISMDMTDDFLESVISDIKDKHTSDDETNQDKGLVEYEISPEKSPNDDQQPSTPEYCTNNPSGSVTPELSSQRSDLSESGFKSVESGYKSTESGFKSCESVNSPSGYSLDEVEKELDEAMDRVSKATLDSLDIWSFVLKICQPLLFRHDRNKCYKETRATPKVWFTENPKLCDCVKDRATVYEELETCKTRLVDRLYGSDQIEDALTSKIRSWYPKLEQCLLETRTVELSKEWETEDSQNSEPATPHAQQHQQIGEEDGVGEEDKGKKKETPQSQSDDISLDREYQRFMDAVWPEIVEPKKESRSTTPIKEEDKQKKKKKVEKEEMKKAKKIKISENWSADSEEDEDADISDKRTKVEKKEDKCRKRKRSSSTISESTDQGEDSKRSKKKLSKKKSNKKGKVKASKRHKMEKKYLKKLKEKQKKKARKLKEKSEKIEAESEEEKDIEKMKKTKKKKQQKQKRKEKKKRAQPSSSSETRSSDSHTDYESGKENKSKKRAKKKDEEEPKSRRKKKSKKKRRKRSTSESAQSDDLFDVNILNNIKTEKSEEELTKKKIEELQEFSPRRQETPRKEIISMKELQNDFESNNIHIKQEMVEPVVTSPPLIGEVDNRFEFDLGKDSATAEATCSEIKSVEFKEPQDYKPTPIPPVIEESNLSQASSQESVCSGKEQAYEKDESHLRPSSQNSNYSFNDVIASQSGYYPKMEETVEPREEYHSYEMYEQLAMEYQSGVATLQQSSGSTVEESAGVPNKIETVVSRGCRGEIKCDWRAGDKVERAPPRPSRWGLKPGDANIVLTDHTTSDPSTSTSSPSGDKVYQIRSVLEQDTYQIESVTGRGSDSGTGYDEAYADMYGASDRLQYGDCFTESPPHKHNENGARSSLDDRIEKVLSEAAKLEESRADASNRNNLNKKPSKATKRVSFADGYKPGQDSDTEAPPTKKRKRARRTGCAWPCPASHPDHVPLWDALPPPPPPPGSPPPPPVTSLPPLHLLRRRAPVMRERLVPPHGAHVVKFDPNMRPPEPPPGLINIPHLQM